MEQKKSGTIIFLTTHNIHKAENICSNIALLNKDNIIEYCKPADICRTYNSLNKFKIILTNGEIIFLENNITSAAKINEYLEKGIIETMHSTEPLLETVFTSITGKKITFLHGYLYWPCLKQDFCAPAICWNHYFLYKGIL